MRVEFLLAHLRVAQAAEHGARLSGACLAAVAHMVAPALLRTQADPEVARRRHGLIVVHHDGDGQALRLPFDEDRCGKLRVDHETLEVELLTAPQNENLHWSLH